jgi:hypothetical protein
MAMAAAVTPVSNYITPHVGVVAQLLQLRWFSRTRKGMSESRVGYPLVGHPSQRRQNAPEIGEWLRASRVHSGGNPLRWRVTLLSRSGRGDLRSSAPECSYLPRLRSAATIVIRNLRDLADNPEDFGSCVDAIELVSH